jgi:hypothetical protein
MKSLKLAAVLFAVCLILAGSVYAADRADVEERYRQAIALRENGDYDSSIDILHKLMNDNRGLSRYEIAWLDVILDQGREMKGSGNPAWKIKAVAAGHRIKAIRAANTGNPDYWVVYAKYSCLMETRKEGYVTKALMKSFVYKPNNPEAYIAQADYYVDSARQSGIDAGSQYGMGNVTGNGGEVNKFNLAKSAKASYEAALAGPVSAARKAYILLNLGDLEARLLGDREAAKKYWAGAVELAPDGKFGKLAAQRLGDKR